ncbi:permease [Nocardioides carbamazepini]|uniref:permease n=1 Tax=Nocardioides carbamazepini TaxID=2854259 RepID=UPI00214A5FE1|nr:permease [Nocardioides carbamazepini]MCR1783476.1 permease [Nocardioides carbamazepini]
MTTASPPAPSRGGGADLQVWLVLGVLLAAVPAQRLLGDRLEGAAFQTWATVFLAIVVQSIPFLVLGVLLSGLISALLSERVVSRALPRNPVLAVPVAGIAGIGLPTCECAAVPVASGLARRGVPAPVALTFLLAAPAINPAVIISTAVAFQGRTDMVVGRFVASLLVAVVIGWIYVGVAGRVPALRLPRISEVRHAHGNDTRWSRFVGAAWHDLLPAGGFLVIGGMVAAAVNVLVPVSIVESVAGQWLAGIVVLAAFAFLVALCSEADAFVAASLTAFSDTAKLVFLVVGPVMDIKLAAMEAGQFGRGFAVQFVPLVLVVATVIASVVGWVLL